MFNREIQTLYFADVVILYFVFYRQQKTKHLNNLLRETDETN